MCVFMGWEFSDGGLTAAGLMRSGGGVGEGEGEVTEKNREPQTWDQPTSPYAPQPLCPAPADNSDRGSAYARFLNTRSSTNRDSDQRKSCSSAVGSARQDTSTADRGEGADGLIKKGPKTRGRLEGAAEVLKAKNSVHGHRRGERVLGRDNWYAWLISNIFYYWLQQCAPRATFIQRASGM